MDKIFSQKLFFTSAEFYKLEKIEFGGDKGKLLGTKVHDIYNEFIEYYQKFASITYDCSDPEDDSFHQENLGFLDKVRDIDQRLSALITQAFDDCHTPESMYKLIVTLGQLLERNIIIADVLPKLPNYTYLLQHDLDLIQVSVKY